MNIDILQSINLVSVFATTLLMMALSSVWYAPRVFGNIWQKAVGRTDEEMQLRARTMPAVLLLTFLCFFVIVFVLAHLITIALHFQMMPLIAVIPLCALVLALVAVPVLWEGRSFQYYIVQAGFALLFLISSTLVLQYWPW